MKGSFDDHVGLLVHGEDGGQKTMIHPDPRGLPSLPPSLEVRLPQLDQNLKVTHAEWLPVTNTRFACCIVCKIIIISDVCVFFFS